jgi:hypothetical protein
MNVFKQERQMRIGIGFILARAITTRHAQEDLKPSWMWNEKTLEQWDSEIEDLQRMQETCSTAVFNRNSTRAALNADLQDLHRRTMQWLAMAKFHFREDPSKYEAIKRLTCKGVGRLGIAREAMDLEVAWQEVGPEWEPTEMNTLASFQALREECNNLDAAFIAAHGNLRTQSEILNHKAAALNRANVAWYAAATRLFPAGTAEGEMIRRSIPTGYSPAVQAEIQDPAPQMQVEMTQ